MYAERLDNYKLLEEKRKTKMIVDMTSDRRGIQTQNSTNVHEFFLEQIDRIGKVEKNSHFHYTRGRATMAAWSLVNLIKQFCDEFEVIIPSKARSSGTIIS